MKKFRAFMRMIFLRPLFLVFWCVITYPLMGAFCSFFWLFESKTFTIFEDINSEIIETFKGLKGDYNEFTEF